MTATAIVTLPAILDIQAAEPLKAELLAARGQALVIDGSSVDRLGGLCLQVLLSAQRTWETDDRPFAISAVSDAFRDQWTIFGAPMRSLEHDGLTP